MAKVFNVNGVCRRDRHYMVDLSSRLEQVRQMVEDGKYFIISRARQYGKTTLLRALVEYLGEEYQVISLDFQNIESDEYINGSTFVHALTREINKRIRQTAEVADDIKDRLHDLADSGERIVRMAEMFACFSEWCEQSAKPIVLFLEEDGRRYFMLYLKPIINGVGNYYIEARTRNQEQTDLIIDYCGAQFIVEMKVWRGNAYHERGEEQLINYLDYYHLKKGYMLSFNFNKKKEIGVKEYRFGDRILIEAVV